MKYARFVNASDEECKWIFLLFDYFEEKGYCLDERNTTGICALTTKRPYCYKGNIFARIMIELLQ